MKINQAIIIANNKNTISKPLYLINNKPFIYYLLEQIKSFGINNIIIILETLEDRTINYINSTNKHNLNIKYIALPNYNIKDSLLNIINLLDNTFLLMHSNIYCPIDFNQLTSDFYKNNANIQLSIYNNNDNYSKNNVKIIDNQIIKYDNKNNNNTLHGTAFGYAIIKQEFLKTIINTQIIYSNLTNNSIYGTKTEHRYYSISSNDKINLTNEFFKEKKIAFLDRDGTLNKKAPQAMYIENPEDFIWLDGAMEAIKILKDNNYTTILVTNQPGIARGNLSIDTLNKIHHKMQEDLHNIGASIDHIYYCPHNWNDNCNCRKPKPGMLYQAQKDLSLDLTKCILFGDDKRDIEAAQNANCKYHQISKEEPLIKAVKKLCKQNKENNHE